jgi:UDP-N-acetylglucosamine--N-acetylmuramyl-(pentapeptide) pyrophosphoryl-undecaprenol N-acetylglucosamine transferase
MTGGSQGAQSVNLCLRRCLPVLLPQMDVLHLCGRGNLDASLDGLAGYCQLEFLGEEMPDALAAADIVLSRAGSNTLSELAALQKPMLLVPYPLTASRGDQIKNAESFRRQGVARVLAQEDMNEQTLSAALLSLLADREELKAALAACPVKDGTEAVLELIEAVQHHPRCGRGPA